MRNLLFILLLLPMMVDGQIKNGLAKYPIDEPSMENLNDWIIGRWKYTEDTNKNNFYEIIRRKPYQPDRYHIKFWNRGGTNASYESSIHFSKVGESLFINVPSVEMSFTNRCFFFLRVLDINADYTEITAALVTDKTMMDLDEHQVRIHIEDNMYDPAFYSDTVHLYKMK